MPIVRFAENKYPEFEVPTGASLMNSLLEQNIPVASSCHGDGVCSKCRLRILAGNENLTPENETEVDLKDRNGLGGDLRISCQVQVLGDLTVDASYW